MGGSRFHLKAQPNRRCALSVRLTNLHHTEVRHISLALGLLRRAKQPGHHGQLDASVFMPFSCIPERSWACREKFEELRPHGKLLRRSGLAEAARAADGVRTLVIPFARRQAAPVERIADGPLRAPLAARAQAYATDADLILTWHRGHADRHILRAGRARRASSRLAFVVIAAQLAEFFLAAAQEGEGQHRREDPHVGLVPDRERERKRSYGRRIQRESAIAPPPRRSAPAARPAIFPGERPLAGAVSSPQAKGPS
jgi:hypothetical protein